MELELKGVVNRVARDCVYISVVNQHGNEVNLTLPREMFLDWKSVNNGDLLLYRLHQDKDMRYEHEVVYVEPAKMTDEEWKATIDEIRLLMKQISEHQPGAS